MILIDYKEKILKFVIYINLLLLAMLVVKNLFSAENNSKEYNYVSTSVIESETDTTSIYVEYPRFNENDEINKIITDTVYGYIKDFKIYDFNKSLDISYQVYYVSDFVNITFHIENTLSSVKNMNLLVNLNNNEVSKITDLFDKQYLENEIYKLVYNKYPIEVYNIIFGQDVNSFTYIIGMDNIEVYFNQTDWEEYNYIPYVNIDLNESITYTSSSSKNKFIAFTYDDGPSEYTEDLLNVLNNNKVGATFFVVGKNIEGREDIINNISNSRSEIGIHGYSHISFKTLNKEELNKEISSTYDILHNIVNDKIKFVRPPYGEYNDNITSLGYDIILWNINSKDWIVRNENKIYTNVMNNACDGCIVLMHDSYKETLEATKRLIPDLKKKGFTVVTVSKLMEIKNYKNDKKTVINNIK